MKIKDIEIFLIKLTIFLRLLSIISAIVLDYCFEDFDMSSNLLLSPEESESNKFIFKGLKAFARWDGLYFSEIFQNSYQFDKNHVFFPFYPMLLKLLNEMSIWRFFSNRIIGMILSALTLNLILNCFNAVLFNRLSFLILRNAKSAFISTLIFICNPASIFFTAVYAESLFTFVTILSSYLFFSRYLQFFNPPNNNLNNNNYLDYFKLLFKPMFLIMISVFIRSNGLFFIVIPGYFVLKDFISFLMIRNVKKAIMMVVIGLCMIILISIPYLIVACGYPYYLYCYENSELIDQKKPQWCSDTIPNAYDYNQNEHWNVGFLQQYRPSRIIFIYWGMHSLIIGAMLIWVFLKEKWLSFLTLGILGEEKKRKYKFTENWNPFMIYTLVLFMISALLAHTQSCTRFFSSSPCFFWYIASKLVPENEDKCKIKIKEKFEVKNKLLLLYILYFNVAGHFMFSNFLPWT